MSKGQQLKYYFSEQRQNYSPCIFIQKCVCKSCEILWSEEFHIAFIASRTDSSGRQNYEKVSVYLNLKLSNAT